MDDLLQTLRARTDLTEAQATQLFGVLTDAATPDQRRVELLAALRDKGETATEVAAFALAMRRAAKDPELGEVAAGRATIDLVGTGGDGAQTLNISTAAALLTAACAQGGLLVVKHGNRAISSRSGASDVLGHLGLPVTLDGPAMRQMLRETGFAYLHAPHYHPGVALVAAARRALGTRSIFNLLGPLSNPARPTHGLIGAYSPAAGALMADALARMEYTRAMVVHTALEQGGLDEATNTAPFMGWLVECGSVSVQERVSTEYGVAPAGSPAGLRGGEPAENAAAIRAIFAGEAHPATETVVLNCAIALSLCRASGDVHSCAEMAREAIASGRATALLHTIERLGQEATRG